MTNYESIDPDKVKEIFASFFTINKNTFEINTCNKTDCVDCLFYNKSCDEDCEKERKKWLDQPVIDWDKDIDWSKVPVDTQVLVWNSESKAKRYFCQKISSACFETFEKGSTSWSSFSNDIFSRKEHWPHCKLYRQEDVEKYRKKDTENG